jgi:hypothetical protein
MSPVIIRPTIKTNKTNVPVRTTVTYPQVASDLVVIQSDERYSPA